MGDGGTTVVVLILGLTVLLGPVEAGLGTPLDDDDEASKADGTIARAEIPRDPPRLPGGPAKLGT